MTTQASAEPGLLTIERSARRLKALRRASFASLVLLLIQYGLGMYTNIYVTVPSADKGGGMGKAISNGPAALSIHAVLALLLILAAIGLIVQAVMARYWTVLAAAAVGLITIIGAAFSGATFTNNGGQDSASLAMAVLAGVALLCYGTVLYLLSSPRQP